MVGIDRFLKEEKYKTASIGLITNPTGITSSGVPTWKALLEAGFSLNALFGPEHGFRGEAQDAVELEDEEFRGIPVYSLYGKRLAPAPEALETLDWLLFDIQDVGCRYYTYLYTLALSMGVCEETGTGMIVTDRPNPILDKPVEGSPIETEYSSFVGDFGLPVVTGLTTGEYALYLKETFFPKVELVVVPMDGYSRSRGFGRTGLPWHLPSPNLPTLDTALVYPGTCLFEGTNLSEGRGTARPFEIIGAPFIDGEVLREALRKKELPGAVFSSLFFTPTFSKWKGESCEGILLNVCDRKVFRPLETGIAVLSTLLELYSGDIRWIPDWNNSEEFFFDKLAGNGSLRSRLCEGVSLDTVMAEVNSGADDFASKTRRYRLYDA